VRAPGERLKIFVHLLNAEGALVAQRDVEPVGGFEPTDRWLPDEQIEDDYGVFLPADLPPGLYTLKLGMYRFSGERLLIQDQGGWGRCALTLGTFVGGPE
jgi:hypothetical protein